jgi:hypothetical protein
VFLLINPVYDWSVLRGGRNTDITPIGYEKEVKVSLSIIINTHKLSSFLGDRGLLNKMVRPTDQLEFGTLSVQPGPNLLYRFVIFNIPISMCFPSQ